MQRFTWLTKWQVLGLIGVLALGMVAATIIAGVLVSNQASAHGGDASLVHACVNQTNAEVRIAHPGPGNENTDCTALGVDWMNVHLDDEWLGAGTGSLSPANLTDNVGIGTTNPSPFRLLVDGSAATHILGVTDGVATGAVWIDNGATTQPPVQFGSVSNHDVGFFTNNQAADVVLTTSGNVGIGTASPNEQLEITGNFRLPATTATTGVIMSNGNRFIHNFGPGNFFAGKNAGNLSVTGGANTGVGVAALSSNTTGCCNTATGEDALKANTTGVHNTATGDGALEANTTGDSNTAIGDSALYQNTTSNSNTAIGDNALFSTTSCCNTAAGVSALKDNTEGVGNTAIGNDALSLNRTGDFNTAAGLQGLLSNFSGSANTSIGYHALTTNTTGDDNTAIGAFAGVTQSFLTNATAVGYLAKVDASNKIRLGNSSVTVVETAGAFSSLSGEFIAGGTTLNVPDYVFEDDYPLLSLDELQAYVAREKHLPNVPSLLDIRSDGLNLSEFQMTLLEKVEELTLYTLAQQREIEVLKEAVATLTGSSIIAEQ